MSDHSFGKPVLLAVLAAAAATYSALPFGPTVQQLDIRVGSQFGRRADMQDPLVPDFQPDLANLYSASDYRPVWVREGMPTPQAIAIIKVLQNAAARGLEPEDYQAFLWQGRLARFQPGSAPASNADITLFDSALSISVMRYISDLHIGRVNPKLCHFAFDIEPKKLDLATFVRERLLDSPNINEALDSVEPPFPGYRRLQNALQKYIALAQLDDHELLPSPGKPVDPGGSYAGCARLARLLRLLGDLPANAAPAQSEVYTDALVDAVKRFQHRHGLDPDGRIGKATVEQLNTPLSRRVRQLQLTLERWRWVSHSFPRPPIVVNIPEFRLRAFNGSYESELEMNVVVGRAYRTRTPVFADDMRYLIFRPYWNVPRSIQNAELLPKIQRDSSYLAENDYEIVNSRDQTVTRGTTDDPLVSALRSGRLAIRQRPGDQNALGLVKFLFPNEYNVYMHDTPAQQLFSRSRRDFSHGCIRVQAPEELAAWVLRDKPEWTRERIHQAMHGKEPMRVNLLNPIPVLIVYGTAVAAANGEISFLADIYGHDASLEKLLAKHHADIYQ